MPKFEECKFFKIKKYLFRRGFFPFSRTISKALSAIPRSADRYLYPYLPNCYRKFLFGAFSSNLTSLLLENPAKTGRGFNKSFIKQKEPNCVRKPFSRTRRTPSQVRCPRSSAWLATPALQSRKPSSTIIRSTTSS